MKDKIVKRLKSITIEGYVVLFFSLLCVIMSLIFIIYLGIALGTDSPMFGSNENESIKRYDIIMIITFSVAFLLALAVFIYNLCFREFKKIPPVTKDIVKGKIVERKVGDNREVKDLLKETVLQEDTSPETGNIDTNKLKKSLHTKKDDKDGEKKN